MVRGLRHVTAVERRACPHCGTRGALRAEHVIKGGDAATQWVCGACAHAWEETDEQMPVADEVEEG